MTLVATGALIIAGIGFTGSYAAVRHLATRKGFGHFSYLFPIGIDAGICALLALDLLLTWIRIPYPLLRQAAWLLTAATIAFNGATAWPDPLGVSMHAVIPVLFIVTVEAARHAIGRIADITADKHMEGVRLSRWLLSPVPTLLLWRRMKLWELRSYTQAIKLEQQRLVYQARLRTRHGRTWRRKAPAEALIPLRLTRYGIPLAGTAPPGPAATDTHPTPAPAHFPFKPTAGPARTTYEATPAVTSTPPQTDTARLLAEQLPLQQEGLSGSARETTRENTGGSFPDATRTSPAKEQSVPAPSPHREDDIRREATHLSSHAAIAPSHRQDGPVVDEHPIEPPSRGHPTLGVVDRYYLAWTQYQAEHGKEPTAEQLSAHLHHQGIHGRQGQPVTPSTLRRYTFSFRIYTVWAQHRASSASPSPHAVAQDCKNRGITAQYNRPIAHHHISQHTKDFERRWYALTNHKAPAGQ
ncbi:DUF2637 domain-containing protein [Streptomyces spiralis]|uniref:DUF2637 domain-containing protein n=1 Tax=Streptomyces spiralis TaxID=66376 RepID=UPI0036B76F9C